MSNSAPMPDHEGRAWFAFWLPFVASNRVFHRGRPSLDAALKQAEPLIRHHWDTLLAARVELAPTPAVAALVTEDFAQGLEHARQVLEADFERRARLVVARVGAEYVMATMQVLEANAKP